MCVLCCVRRCSLSTDNAIKNRYYSTCRRLERHRSRLEGVSGGGGGGSGGVAMMGGAGKLGVGSDSDVDVLDRSLSPTAGGVDTPANASGDAVATSNPKKRRARTLSPLRWSDALLWSLPLVAGFPSLTSACFACRLCHSPCMRAHV
jgi:hypothetical protein